MQQQRFAEQEQASNSLLEQELSHDEQLRWYNQPGSKNQAKSLKPMMPLPFIFGGIGLILSLLGTIFSNVPGTNDMHTVGLVFGIIGGSFLLVTLIFSLIILFVRLPADTNLIYAITNKRVLIIKKGNKTTFTSYSAKDIGPIRRTEHPDGSGDIIFSNAVISDNGYNYSYSTSTPSYNYNHTYQNGRNQSGKFVGIPNVREVERILRDALFYTQSNLPNTHHDPGNEQNNEEIPLERNYRKGYIAPK